MPDAKQMEMLWKFDHGPRFENYGKAVAAIGQVGTGGDFLDTDHSQAHFHGGSASCWKAELIKRPKVHLALLQLGSMRSYIHLHLITSFPDLPRFPLLLHR